MLRVRKTRARLPSIVRSRRWPLRHGEQEQTHKRCIGDPPLPIEHGPPFRKRATGGDIALSGGLSGENVLCFGDRIGVKAHGTVMLQEQTNGIGPHIKLEHLGAEQKVPAARWSSIPILCWSIRCWRGMASVWLGDWRGPLTFVPTPARKAPWPMRGRCSGPRP